MKHLSLILLLFSAPAFAATAVTETPGTTTSVYRGTSAIATVPDYPACITRARQDASTRAVGSYSYGCQDARDRLTIVVTTDAPTVGWVRIANEDQAFTLVTARAVRYGTGTAWATRQLSAGVHRCNNDTFGDPAQNVVKGCETQDTVPAPVTGSALLQWAPPADASLVTGYRVYRGTATQLGAGTLLPATARSYTFAQLPSGDHAFGVSSVGSAGDSAVVVRSKVIP